MAVFVYRDGRMVDRDTGEPMNPEPLRGPMPCPMVIGDIQPYKSPITGEVISGNRAKRADLDKHNCVDAADFPMVTGGKLKNKKFAEKHGLTHLLKEEAR